MWKVTLDWLCYSTKATSNNYGFFFPDKTFWEGTTSKTESRLDNNIYIRVIGTGDRWWVRLSLTDFGIMMLKFTIC